MAPRGRMSTVTITGEHRLHEESMLSYHLIMKGTYASMENAQSIGKRQSRGIINSTKPWSPDVPFLRCVGSATASISG
jgi:hypothetical protein